MSKLRKSISAILFTLLAVCLCFGVLTACDSDKKSNQVDYVITVVYPDDAAAENVTVTLNKAGKSAGSAKTNADGAATIRAEGDEYDIVLSDLPQGFKSEGGKTNKIGSPISITLVRDLANTINYSVTVKTAGGLLYPNLPVEARVNGNTVLSEKTDENGVATLALQPGVYDIVPVVPAGYKIEGTHKTDAEGSAIEITISSAVIMDRAPTSAMYALGSIVYNFSVTPFDSKQAISLAELLKTKKAVVLNFWYSTCSWCIQEFPAMEEVYREYKDKLEILAIDPIDGTNADIESFRIKNGLEDLTFPMALDDAGVASRLPIQGYPTTAVIDRYGAIAFLNSGAEKDPDVWRQIFDKYTADNYVQNFPIGELQSPEEKPEREKPDVEMPASSVIEEAINNTQSGFNFSYRAEVGTNDAEYSWPWVVGSKDGKDTIIPSNSGKDNSYSIIHTDVTLKQGDAIAFDFFSSTEQGADILYVLVDSLVEFQISGISMTWQTCYAYVAEKAGTFDVAFIYMKDYSKNSGDDTVHVTNMRILPSTEIPVTTDIMRNAANDLKEDGLGYNDYVTAVYNEEDGYYHVGTANGPYLLADFVHVTNWSSTPIANLIYSDEIDFRFDFDDDGNKENCSALYVYFYALSLDSDYPGLVPVNRDLHKLLTLLMQYVAKAEENRDLYENEWLEVCKYITRYGSNEPIPNPVLGLTAESAIPAHEGKNKFSLYKELFPTGSLAYTFTPEKSGVYHFYSKADAGIGTQIWIYNDDGIEDGLIAYCGDDMFSRDVTFDYDNFNLYLYMEAGVRYFVEPGYYWGGTTGTFDFYIDYVGETHTELETCTPGFYTSDIDEEGNMGGDIHLSMVDVVLYEGNYYEKKANGERGSLIYVDFTFVTRANGEMSLERIINSVYSPVEGGTETIHPFDFSKDFDEDGHIIDADGEDYTARLLELLALAEENDGLLAATEELKDILSHYAARFLFNIENEWLAFCWYYHTYEAPYVPAE